ncbi:MAG TPA: glycosyl hydrolase-related protein, partial [bacterium]|nr:glycosyl hydrolase-related protein [bacterium]
AGLTVSAPSSDVYVRKKTWWESMLASRQALRLLRQKVASSPTLRLSDWHTIGPLSVDSPFVKNFDPTAEIVLSQQAESGQAWIRHPEWRDGKTAVLTPMPNAVQFVYRTITVQKDTSFQIYLGSDDGIAVWLNGGLLLRNDKHRPCRPNQEILSLALNRGVNHLLMKITNNAGDFEFYFSLLHYHPDALWPLLERDFNDASLRMEMALEIEDKIWQFTEGDEARKLAANYINAYEQACRKRGLSPETWSAKASIDSIRKKYLEIRMHEPNYFYGGQVQLICSSHQDIAWMDSPEKCMEQRDEQVITPALALMRQNSVFRYGMESMMNLMEYLQRHPERREEVRQRTESGRLEWGATYNQPYESLLSGEQLVREVYLGRKWIKKNMPGCDARVAWNPDVPARSLQMQQILHKAGIPYLIISRHEKGVFRWSSPDGSSVLVFSPGHYGNPMAILDRPTMQAVMGLREELAGWDEYYRERKLPPALPLLYSNDAAGPRPFTELIEAWNNLSASGDSDSSEQRMVYATAEQFFQAIDVDTVQLQTLCGERPNVWLYIHGPSHHRAISSKRAAGVLLPAAEIFHTVEGLLAGHFNDYPEERLNAAWAASIFDDHGWGGNQGQITDQLFRSKLDFAANEGEALLQAATAKISSRIQFNRKLGQPIVVFNALSWQRSDPVWCTIHRQGPYRLIDHNGETVLHQVLAAEPGQPLDEERIVFFAKEVPAVGYRVYYVTGAEAKSAVKRTAEKTEVYENQFYKIHLSPGGIRQIFDKQLQKAILREGGLLGAELFTLQSVGNGAGEFDDVQQPTMEGFDQAGRHQPVWRMSANGPVCTQFSLRVGLAGCTAVETLTIFNDRKQIDCDLSLLDWDGTPYREFRLAWPLAMIGGRISYEAPMAVVTVGKDEIPGAAGHAYGRLNYSAACKDVHPREVQNFISASDDRIGVTMSSSVAVCDYVDPTDAQNPCPVLQPVLLASRKSCHSNGNWYLQEGDHHYHFSLFSHAPGWSNGYRLAVQANHRLTPVTAVSTAAHASLPEFESFCSLSSANVVLTALKKCEDDDQIILRCVDMEGKDSQNTIRLFVPLQNAKRTNIIEEEGEALTVTDHSVEVFVGHHAIETIKCTPDRSRR